ncbi:uncharacterized protein LOC111325903 isoform X2 [Stylophora pistillata]|uniref:uncharacterized protein LOC111325903 isoform X2 n=1 Tax=Stylophora pistillata TaxID=50429 RepID=UPI000C03C03F|nr:uncharacterized protein LOC111325903 isoform X2 [Stylophora pistillata]
MPASIFRYPFRLSPRTRNIQALDRDSKMRTPLICFLLLVCLLVMEAKSISVKKEHKTDAKELEEALKDLRESELNLHRGRAKENYQEQLKALTEEESDAQSGNGELRPEDY